MTTSTAHSIGGESRADYHDTIDLAGKTVFVAGGTSGINLGIAEDFARAGARVAVLSRSQDKVDATVGRLHALGAEAWAPARTFATTQLPRRRWRQRTINSGRSTC
jgi:NAD(P)-dependent dehydrogenase (short-subunit alcohol dehydrogenase family)